MTDEKKEPEKEKKPPRAPLVMPELMNAQQAADYCGMGKSTLYKMVNAGLFPDGRHLPWGKRWHRDLLQSWLDEQWQEAAESSGETRAA